MTARKRNDGMGIAFLTTDELGRHMWRYIESREWWTIPWVSQQSVWLCQEIEARYYAGAANADFVLMTCPVESGARAVAFARKERMPADALLQVMDCREASGMTADDLNNRDVILATDEDDLEAQAISLSRVRLWQAWLMSTREAA